MTADRINILQNIGDKKAVKITYDSNAGSYASHTMMQQRNLEVLAKKIFAIKGVFADVLDIGAGSGLSLTHLETYADKTHFTSLVRTDISGRSLLAAPNVLCCPDIKLQCDAENLPFMDKHFSLVYANSVLHWLTAESGMPGFEKGISEALRVTKSGGLFAASIAAVGTSRSFFRAYESVIALLDRYSLAAPSLEKNPIGAMELHNVVDTLLSFGAKVISAELIYEPVLYSSAKEYIDDVKAYGYHFLLNGVEADLQSVLWEKISQSFTEEVGSGQYLHDQYMIYVLALPT